MRIGISFLTHENQNLWSNGLDQNIVFLAHLLQQLPFVQSVGLIKVGDQRRLPPQLDSIAEDLPLMSLRDAGEVVDVVIEMGGALDVCWLDWMRARGKKVVYHCCGQPYVAWAETVVFDQPNHFTRPDRCDEVWYLPKDACYAPMLRTMHRCEVHEVPFIWHPRFLDARIREVRAQGYEYGYSRRDASTRGLHVAIFEPNLSVVKSAVLPMLICDAAYRANRDSVTFACALNARRMYECPASQSRVRSLDLFRHRKMGLYERHDTVTVLAQRPNAVVSHQWQNDQNYLYLDVLYGGYPLIHNSPWLKDVGYYYPAFDVQRGAAQLLRAVVEHDAALGEYYARTQDIFDMVHPSSQPNLAAYAERLLHLCEGAAFAPKAGA